MFRGVVAEAIQASLAEFNSSADAVCAALGERVVGVDGSQSPEALQAQVESEIEKRINGLK